MADKHRSDYVNGNVLEKTGSDVCIGEDDVSLHPSSNENQNITCDSLRPRRVDKQISSRLMANMTKCAMDNFSRLLLEATGHSTSSEGINENGVEYAGIRPIVNVCMKNLDFKTLMNSGKLCDKNAVPHLKPQNQFSADDSTPIHKLPNEMLDYIYSFLDIKTRIRTELVCRRWRWVGKNIPWTWPTKLAFQDYLKFDYTSRCQNGHIIYSILSRCGLNLTEIEMSCDGVAPEDAIDATVKIMKMIGDYCPNLSVVTFEGFTKFASPYIQRLAKRCPQLKSITLDNYQNLLDGDVYHFVKQCQALEYLDISSSSEIRGDCFKGVGKNLKILRLGSCSSLQPVALESIMSRCSSIQELRLLFCSQLPQSLLFKVFYFYKDKLKVLHLDGYAVEKPEHQISWGGMRFLTNLEELSLTVCDGVDDDLLQCISKKCVNLRLLSVGGSLVTDRGVVQLAALPHLKVLNISNTEHIKGDGMQALAAQGHLEELYAVHSAMESPDESFSYFAQYCPDFRILDVQGTKKISNTLIAAFMEAVKANFLKSRVILVVGGTSVTDDVELCNGLELVSGDMHGWEMVGDDDVSDSDDVGSTYCYDKNGYDKFGFYNYHFENFHDQNH